MTIPASTIARVTPGVLAAGGSNLTLSGLFLTQNTLVPTGEVLSFPSQSAVSAYFGPGAAETLAAAGYFLGYLNSTAKPSAMMFAPYNLTARSAWLQGGSLATMTLAELQAITPSTLSFVLDGETVTSSSINLSAATSFSNAATIILAAFEDPGFSIAWNAVLSCFIITDTTSGATSTISFATTSTVATGLALTLATGATLSQGAVLDTPTSAMNNAYAASQNWETMVPLFEPSLSNKELFAAWFNEQNDEFLYLAWDSDVQASVQNATEPFGVVAKAAEWNGVACIGGDPAAVPAGNTLAAMVMNVAIFVAGAIASINFAQTNGRATIFGKGQAGLLVTCANQTTAANLLANGYSYYGAYATRANNFVLFNNGNMPGEFDWIDTFVDDAWLQDQFQVALMTLATTAGSVPYNNQGYGLIRSALATPIAAAINFGAIRAGINLNAEQLAEAATQAGQDISIPLQNQGWYLQIQDPGSEARQARTSPIINFWYTDGGAVQSFSMDSTDIL